MKKIIFSALVLSLGGLSYGQVGINTKTPQETLHILGTLRLQHPSMGGGKILRVYKDGSMKWANGVPSPVTGSFLIGGYTTVYDASTMPDTSIRNKYLGGYISLRPGRWIVKLSLLIPTKSVVPAGNQLNVNEGFASDTYFSDSSTDGAAPTLDYMSGSSTIISGSQNTPSIYGMVMGSVLIENKTTSPKTYYLQGSAIRYSVIDATHPTMIGLDRFGSGYWGENRIYAIPIE